jgi:hypothetical protein
MKIQNTLNKQLAKMIILSKVIISFIISAVLFCGCSGLSFKTPTHKLRYATALRTILIEGVEYHTNGVITVDRIYSVSDKEALKFIAEGAMKGVNPLQ